jgi:hypothetical protein
MKGKQDQWNVDNTSRSTPSISCQLRHWNIRSSRISTNSVLSKYRTPTVPSKYYKKGVSRSYKTRKRNSFAAGCTSQWAYGPVIQNTYIQLMCNCCGRIQLAKRQSRLRNIFFRVAILIRTFSVLVKTSKIYSLLFMLYYFITPVTVNEQYGFRSRTVNTDSTPALRMVILPMFLFVLLQYSVHIEGPKSVDAPSKGPYKWLFCPSFIRLRNDKETKISGKN